MKPQTKIHDFRLRILFFVQNTRVAYELELLLQNALLEWAC